jgi:hypothetical protein
MVVLDSEVEIEPVEYVGAGLIQSGGKTLRIGPLVAGAN